MANITEYPEVQSISEDDKIFVNKGGKLSQIKQKNAISGGDSKTITLCQTPGYSYENDYIGCTKQTTLKELCQLLCAKFVSERLNSLQVKFWASSNDCVYSSEVQSAAGFGWVFMDVTPDYVRLEFRDYNSNTTKKNAYTNVNEMDKLNDWSSF